jgi:autoinducer 2 (AI-2) kinase
MIGIIEHYCRRVSGDEAIRSFAATKDVTVRYVVPDLDLVFFMCFTGNPVGTGLGEPPTAPQLTLKMNAQVLDDVMCERLGGMKAAMSGLMAFSGNTMKAMSLQRIQKDLSRLYQQVRAERGDPGDLGALSTKGSAGRPGATSTTEHRHPGAVGRGSGKVVGDERDEMVAIVGELHASGLITSTGGNVCMRRPHRPGEAWITPSALPKGSLRPEVLVRVDLDGEPLDAEAMAPSSERLMHCAILRSRPDVQAVVHSHPPKAIVFAMAGLDFAPISTEAAYFTEIPRVPFTMPGSPELAEAVAEAMGAGPAVMLINHGLVVAGSSLRRALDLTEIIEHTCEVIIGCHQLGKKPPVLPEDVVELLRELGDQVA